MTQDKQHNRPNVPPLRFPEFTDEWEHRKLSEFTERVTRKNKGQTNLPLTISAQYGLVDQISFFNNKVASADMSNYYLLKKGEFTYNKSYSTDYPLGAIKRLDRYEMGALSTLYICFKINDDIESDFLVHYFESPKWHRGVYEIAGEGARNHGLLNIAVGDFFETQHFRPKSIREQEKIAHFLTLIQHRIEVQSGLIEDLQKLKAAIIEHLYNQNNTESRIGDMVTQVSIRNRGDNDYSVLSVNNRLGFIEQSEQFEDRLVASEDTSNYKVVSRDDFAYNPARINVGSIARLTSFEKGIVSPMYICFHTKKLLLPQYLEHFFATRYFDYEMQKRLEGSVRLCLSWEGLCNIPIAVPSIEKQECIGNRISRLADKIFLEERYLGLLKIQKQYLLQAMFI